MTRVRPDLLPGTATLEIGVADGVSAVTSCYATSPMKLLVPRARGRSVWAYASTLGGGMVAGDSTCLEVRLGAGSRAFCGTQASTKIYRSIAGMGSTHRTRACLEDGALLVWAPEPVQAFAGSIYEQRQTFHLGEGAGLVLVDCLSSGRLARGERWSFARLQSRTEIFRLGERVLLDALLLENATDHMEAAARLGRFNCLALLVLAGSELEPSVTNLLDEAETWPVNRRDSLVRSASRLASGGVLVRLAAVRSEDVKRELRRLLRFVPTLLGDDPWARNGGDGY